MLQRLIQLPGLALIGLVRGYQLFISPHLPPMCRYQPTCSQYAILALRNYGVFKGLVLTAYRLGRCHPFGGHGYDPPKWFGEPDLPLPSEETADHSHTH
ncbi:MAG: membrane protein insertion efficiency factor YidD [Rhodothermales bacterium]|nr:membrane protein insertion efficiency factor YidD [Rhodothermales bacterium]